MLLTCSYRDHVKARIEADPEFRAALFQEAVQTLIEGDVGTARMVLRDFINATVGFPALAKATGIPPKSLMRMFGRAAIRPRPICRRSSACCRRRPACSSKSARQRRERRRRAVPGSRGRNPAG